MSSGHGHGSAAPTPRGALLVAFFLTSGFMIVEAVVGWWSGSLALLSDAGHMLGDAGALLLSLIVAQVALRPRSRRHTFGLRRAEVMGALVNAAALLAVAVTVILEAIERLRAPGEIEGLGMLVTAALGLLVNIVAAFVLSRGASGNLNVKSAFYHVLSDALGSVAAIVAGVLLITLGWAWADPAASLAISALILIGAVRLFGETTHVLMEGTPDGVDVAALERTIAATDGVRSVHDLHVWCVTPGVPMLTAHVVLEQGFHGTIVAREVGERVHEAHRIDHVTIQPEAPDHVVVPLRRKEGSGG